MKIADKIKITMTVPGVQERRRLLRSMSYLVKRNPKTMTIQKTKVANGKIMVELIQDILPFSFCIERITLTPLSSYF